MFQEASPLEHRLSDLQAQIDRLTVALLFWRDGHERTSEVQVAAASTPPHANLADDERVLFEGFATTLGTPAAPGAAPESPGPQEGAPTLEPGDGPLPEEFEAAYYASVSDATTRRIAGIVEMLRSSEDRVSQLAAGQDRLRRVLILPLVVVMVALAVGGWRIWQLQGDLDSALARLQGMEQRSSISTPPPVPQDTAAPPAAPPPEPARASTPVASPAPRSQAMANVLAAADVVRFGMTAPGASSAQAELLWSRSRGTVVNATSLPALVTGTVDQAWLRIGGTYVSLGLFAPGADGRATLVARPMPQIPAAATGGLITTEPQGGSSVPSDRIVTRSSSVVPLADPPQDR